MTMTAEKAITCSHSSITIKKSSSDKAKKIDRVLVCHGIGVDFTLVSLFLI